MTSQGTGSPRLDLTLGVKTKNMERSETETQPVIVLSKDVKKPVLKVGPTSGQIQKGVTPAVQTEISYSLGDYMKTISCLPSDLLIYIIGFKRFFGPFSCKRGVSKLDLRLLK